MNSFTLFLIIFNIITYGVIFGYLGYDFLRQFNNSKIKFFKNDKSIYRFVRGVLISPVKPEYISKTGKSYQIPKNASYFDKYGKPVYLMDIDSKISIPMQKVESKNELLLSTVDEIVQQKVIKGFAKAMSTKQKEDNKMMIIVVIMTGACCFLGGFITAYFMPMLMSKP